MCPKIAMRFVLALGLGVIVAQAQTQPPTTQNLPGPASAKTEPATIQGRVVRASDGSPLKKAVVMAMTSQGGQMGPIRPKTATTDADGKFLLKDLEPGRYTLSATRSGFARQVYG